MMTSRTQFLPVLVLLAATAIRVEFNAARAATPLSDLPVLTAEDEEATQTDWLVEPVNRAARVYRSADGREIVMTNGLIRRAWRVQPNVCTVGFDDLVTQERMIRGVKPEAMVTLGGHKYDIGGLLGQEEYAYLRLEWLDSMTRDPKGFAYVDGEAGATTPRLAWKRKRYSADLPWPPPGASVAFRFKGPADAPEGVTVTVHYEMYDGIPVVAKWLSIRNAGREPIVINSFASEILAVAADEAVANRGEGFPKLHLDSDYAFMGMTGKTARWLPDPQHLTQITYDRSAPLMLVVQPPLGPEVTLAPGAEFESFRTFELVHDSTDRERRGLALRRMYRALTPWATENPILMHVRNADPASIRLAVDQCAEVGFEMVIMSFGSDFDAENEDPSYIAQLKELADYAHGKGVELGGYSLLASRKISDEDDAINPRTGKPGGAIFENSPCLGSRWGEDYFRRLRHLFEATGLDVLEHDGSYPGDVCASTKHPGHRGLNDSQWMQWRTIADFYNWCRARGVYLNVPDWYFMNGSNKTAMGYRETNWSLPRDRQILLGRQNIFDGTWEKTPSMGWMFVPLVEYHGGGEAATLEPLAAHLDAYAAHLAQNFGSGVQACYRGPRLFDSEKTKAVVKQWVDFYRKYREILDADIIHVWRPDGRGIDCMLHVNPRGKCKGLAMVYNPLGQPVQTTLRLPLYYTGLTDSAMIREQEGEAHRYTLDRRFNASVPVKLGPQSVTWLIVE